LELEEAFYMPQIKAKRLKDKTINTKTDIQNHISHVKDALNKTANEKTAISEEIDTK
jgi:hypothetical protein